VSGALPVEVEPFRQVTRICAAIVLAVTLLVLLGWCLGSSALTSRGEQWLTMNPMVAVVLLLGAGVLLAPAGHPATRLGARAAGGVALAFGLACLADAYLGTSFQVDQWLFPEKLATVAPYHHAAIPTDLAALCLGLAYLLADAPALRGALPRELWALAAALIAYHSLLPYAFGALFAIKLETVPMAANTAVCVIALAVGLLCADPTRGLMRHVASPSPGGRLLRTLLPAMLLLPLLVGFANRFGRWMVPIDVRSDLVLAQAVLVGVAMGFAWWLGAALNREDEARRAYEQALAEREAALRLALARTFDLVGIFVDERLVYVNEASVRMMRARDASELLGLSIFHSLHPDLRPLSEKRIATVLAGGEVPVIETTLVRADGTLVELEVTTVAITYQGQPALQVIGRDITGRKAMEQALRESNLRFQTLFEGVEFGILVVDPGGRVLESNGAFCKLLGQPAEALLGVAFTSLVHPDDLKLVLAPFWDLVNAGHGSFKADVRLEGERELWACMAAFYVAHQPPKVMLIIEDVTPRHELEQRLRHQNEQLKQVERMRSDVINAVTHDIRTPLTAVIGYAEMLGDELAGTLNDQQHEFVRVLKRNGRRLVGMIEDMLDFARLEAGTFELHYAPVNFRRVVEEVVKTFVPAARQAGLTLEARLPAEPVVGEADQDRVERVLFNLVNNAIKFTHAGGTVRIEVAVHDDRIRCAVIDTGVGISEEEIGKLFHNFTRLDEGAKKTGSTGIGLYVCKALVEAHHGTIGVKSEPGKGSEFWFELPIAPLTGVAEEPTSTATPPRPGHRSTGT
jgi:PAS domain S-box-containing protein